MAFDRCQLPATLFYQSPSQEHWEGENKMEKNSWIKSKAL